MSLFFNFGWRFIMKEYDGILMGFLDNDLYKFTMQQVVLHHFSQVEVEYEFRCRNKNIEMGAKLGQLMSFIEEEINKMRYLTLTPKEKEYLKKIKFLKPDYIEFLENFRYNPEKHVKVYMEHGELAITIKGNWVQTILYEVPILAIVSDLATKYNFKFENSDWKSLSLKKLNEKVEYIKQHELYNKFKLADFGTRRRSSAENHDMVVRYLKEQLNVLGNGCFVGTSNVHLAMKYGVNVVGTMAHEMLMGGQALYPINDFQSHILDVWMKEYDGDLGIALTDTVSMDSFLKCMTKSKSLEFSGCRHDSGNPFTWADKLINHYRDLNIDPTTKQAVFSDGLSVKKAFEILRYVNDRIQCSFGIGTHLTNDIGIEPANIVIKMQRCNGFPVAKISDEPEKAMCQSQKFLEFLKELYNIGG